MIILQQKIYIKNEVFKISNILKTQTSPYLLQHAENPVDWFPWCSEAFEKARAENKPVFVSIGYSTCHWCHVMAHESFEDEKTAELMNKYFVCIKVDKEERPDIDSIYMSVCQAFTGSGGWPLSIFMTPDQKPFFAGTYFPKTSKYGSISFTQLLTAVGEKWSHDRSELESSANEIIRALNSSHSSDSVSDSDLINRGVNNYVKSFDKEYGGFSQAPKFPSPHNLLFLLNHYEKFSDRKCLDMACKTLRCMYMGGMFDHIGYGFSRYSTDRFWLVPHFEKMLYDNALLISAYSKAYEITKDKFYLDTAKKTAMYIIREMTSDDGGFYSAQDADSEGEEGRYYVFTSREIIDLLGEKSGREFNSFYDITAQGNFEGKSIPNLLRSSRIPDISDKNILDVYNYRKKRNRLHLDDKILTSWNSLMISALCGLYRVSTDTRYLDAAINAQQFIESNLCKDDSLYVSWRCGRQSGAGFLDDYANYTAALLALYDATLQQEYLDKAEKLLDKTLNDFYDTENGGFYLSGSKNETLIMRPKETYDGAVPSGNSVMAYNLVRFSARTEDKKIKDILVRHMAFMSGQADDYPAAYAMFLSALLEYTEPSARITAVIKNKDDIKNLIFGTSLGSTVKILHDPTKEYPLLNNVTTYYVCSGHSCLPPFNDPEMLNKIRINTDNKIK